MVRSSAHPVARKSHDRTIDVRLTPGAVVVEYLLEADKWTVVFVDLPAVNDKVDLTTLSSPREFYEAFTRVYAPILADNLDARLDGKPLAFTCESHRHEEKDSVQCTFRFRAPWKLSEASRHVFTFREGNYETEPGLVRLSLSAAGGVALVDKDAPDEALKAKPEAELKPGDEERLRKASATFTLGALEPLPPVAAPDPPAAPEGGPREEDVNERVSRLLDKPWGFWAALSLMFGWGAYHALTPGHGKTLVAAYLVGERGTLAHALFLGVVTTVSHTGVLLVLAALFRLFPEWFTPLMAWLPLLAALLITVMGAWLLLCRLTGRADHVHLIGDHHHADGGHGGHYHNGHGHGHGHGHGPPADAGWGRLFVLGVTGGMIPCPAAVVITVLLINVHRIELALPLLLAFSAGLGGVLVAIGVAVVRLKGFAESRWGTGGGRLFRVLPVASAAAVMLLGLFMVRDALGQR